jgi:hypothetical protein
LFRSQTGDTLRKEVSNLPNVGSEGDQVSIYYLEESDSCGFASDLNFSGANVFLLFATILLLILLATGIKRPRLILRYLNDSIRSSGG